MPDLSIVYKGRTIFEGEVSEFTWQESSSEVMVKGRLGSSRQPFGSMITGALLGSRKVPAVDVGPAEVGQDSVADAPGAE